MLGQLVELPGNHVKDDAIFAGAVEVGNGNIAFDRNRKNPEEQVNSRALLKARLLDVFMGDWDRHRWQWRWAKPKDDPRWHPIPEDRDQAFARLDGVFPSRAKDFAPQTVGFKDEYPSMYNITFNGREVDRRFLVDLEKPVWDSTAVAMQSILTDGLIEEAVRKLPPEMYEIDGPRLERQLKMRRDHLPQAADEYYHLLAETVEIQATDVAEIVQVTDVNGKVEVRITAQGATKPYFKRVFDPAETKEVRMRLHGGDDRIEINGKDELPLKVRILGGDGDDEVHYASATNGVTFYDHAGNNRVSGQKEGRDKIKDKPYNDWEFQPDVRAMPLDWGKWGMPIAVIDLSGDFGFLLGYGRTFFNYGFRKRPYAQRHSVSGAVSSQLKWQAKLDSDFRWENTPWHHTFLLQASTLDVVHYYGLGNDTKREQEKDFYRVDRWEVTMAPALARQFGKEELVPAGPLSYKRQTALSFGAAGRFSSTKREEDSISGSFPDLYGAGENIGQIMLYSQFKHESRDMTANPTKGTTLNIIGTYSPAIWDVTSHYGFVDAVGSAYISLPAPLLPVLALRAGGKKVWGNFPYYDAAYLGAAESLRGYDRGRFAGDASAYAGTDLRFQLFQTKSLLLTNLGLFGFVDAGRVWVDGDSPGDLHTGYGVGIWASFIGRPNTASLCFAFGGDDDMKFYIWWGFAF
jgi:hypothetical protein